jgi:type II secretory pathway pseudopilin PulG
LVVITIIGMLMAMVFPAIGQVVDAVRRAQCGQRLAGLGTALGLFRNANQTRWPSVSTQPVTGPPGAVAVAPGKSKKQSKQPRRATGPSGGSGFSWLVQLLPYLDEAPLYQRINVKSGNQRGLSPFDPALRDDEEGGRHLSTYPIKAFQCPAFESDAEVEYGSLAPEYQALASPDTGKAVSLTNYVAMSATHLACVVGSSGNSEADSDAPLSPNGVITYRAKGGINTIKDGASKTIVAVESREQSYASWMDGTTAWVVAHDPNSEEPQMIGGKWRCEGRCRHALNVGEDTPDGQKTNYRDTWAGQKAWRFGPSSTHPGGVVNHLGGEGNIIPLVASGPAAVDPTIYLHLVTRNGGETVEGY